MLNNPWLTGSLFLGLLLTVALVSSIPTYTSGVLHKLLTKELVQYQAKNNQFPGGFSFSIGISTETESSPAKSLIKAEHINEELIEEAGLPVVAKANSISTIPLKISLSDEASQDEQDFGRIVTLSDVEKHIIITDGKLPSENVKDGIYEVLIPERSLHKRKIVLNKVLKAIEGKQEILVRPVGTFKAKSERDPYWETSPDRYTDDFILPEEQFRKLFLTEKQNLLGNSRFYSAFDYQSINTSHIPNLLRLEDSVKEKVSKVNKSMILVDFPIQYILARYLDKERQLTTMLWSLNIPILIMMAIYLFMVVRLIINRQLNEIAVMASRGATRQQIVWIYFLEISLLGLAALIIGPFLGLWLCNILGASNGFLEFIQRSSLQLEISKEAYLYAFCAVAISILMVMIPVYQASKKSIVHHKQHLARFESSKNWLLMIIDVLLVVISIYGLFTFKQRQKELMTLSNADGELLVDPLLFFIPALFIIGMGLLILRIYPFILKALGKMGGRFWSLPLYSTFIQVSRSSKQYQFLMLFLIMTIGLGVFSASSARTINTNLEQQIRYKNGADISLQIKWDSNEPSPVAPTAANGKGTENETASVQEVVYSEPPFDPFLKLKSAEHAAKVYRKESMKVEGNGKKIYSASLMGIEPKEFGKTAWFEPSLLPHHWYNYLNLLSSEPSSVLISKSIAGELGIKVGDYFTIESENSIPVEFVVFGIVEYWPSFNPLEKGENTGDGASLIVANLPYIQNTMGLEPYEIWLKVKKNVSRASLYAEISNKKLPVTGISDINPKIIELKNGAFLLGLNGTLTLGFIVSLLVTFIGFILYWVLTIKSRTLQYGVYLAMGMPNHQLISILLWEQIFTSGAACFLGVILGKLTSTLFVPLFQLSFDPKEIVPPFRVLFQASDGTKIYFFVFFMLAAGLTLLAIFLKQIRIHQAIKLGED